MPRGQEARGRKRGRSDEQRRGKGMKRHTAHGRRRGERRRGPSEGKRGTLSISGHHCLDTTMKTFLRYSVVMEVRGGGGAEKEEKRKTKRESTTKRKGRKREKRER